MAFKYALSERRRAKSHSGWLFLIIVGYLFFAGLKFFLQVDDPWPFFTLLVILLGLALGAYAVAHRTNDIYYHGISPAGLILLSDAGFEIRGDDGERRILGWEAFSDIVLDTRRRSLTFFPVESLSFEFSPSEVGNIDEMTREIQRYFKVSYNSGVPTSTSND